MADNSFRIKNSLVLNPTDLTTLLNPQAGDLACDINDSNKIKRYDANASAWTEVGSGGVGSVNIMFVQDFESASLSTFTQTGLSLTTTDPLHGRVSALLTHQAGVSPTNDQSFKQIIPVDPKFRGQAMVLDLNVKSSASAGNVTIKITDESAPADLIASEQLQLSNDVSGRRSSVSFTIPSTCASLSYTITALPEAGSPVTRIDDIVAMLSDVSLLETSVEFQIPVVTEWTDYSMTIGASTTAPTKGVTSVDKAQWRRVGSDMEIRYDFKQTSAGSAGSGIYLFPIPSGYTIDNTKVPSGSADQAVVGVVKLSATTDAVGVTTALGQVLVSKTYPNRLGLNYTQSTVENTAWVSSAAYQLSGATIGYSFSVKVPIVGWTSTETTTKTIPLTQSGLVQEGDSALKAAGNAGQAITAAVTDIPFIATSMIGNSMSWSGSALTVLEAGIYTIDAQTKFTTAVERGLNIYVNGVRVGSTGEYLASTTNHCSYNGYFNVGDVLSVRTAVNGGTLSNVPAEHLLSITHAGSLKQIAVSSDQKITIPTSELRFEGASSRGSTATAIVKFDTMAKLRGDAFIVESDSVLGTRITMKKAGKISISASAYLNTTSANFAITKNQANLTTFPLASETMCMGGGNGAVISEVAWTGDALVGDIFRIYGSVVPTAGIGNILNVHFQEQDISVSVTNTLPQFSESDSSVRLDTANGYGSTATKIRRFSNVRENIGSDILYTDDAATGTSFTVRSAGIYNISYSDSGNAAGQIGLTLNSANLSANISTLNGNANNEVLAIQDRATTASTNYTVNCSWQGYLNVNDIVRPHSDGLAPSNVNGVKFTISKVGKPNVTGVDVTPFVNVPQPDVASYSVINSPNGFGSTYTQSPRFLSIQQNDGTGILSYTDSATLGAYWTANKKCIATISLNSIYLAASAWSFRIFKNQTGVNTGTGLTTIDDQANTRAGGTISVELNAGDRISFYYSSTSMNRTEEHVFITATALSDQILTAPETFSTDTASLQYASSSLYNLTTLANAPVGTYITFTYAANTNTATQTTTPPSQSPADMNVNGIQIFTRAYNATSSATQPAAIAIQIGKGLKGTSVNGFLNTGKVGVCNLDLAYISSLKAGLSNNAYEESTGILYLDGGSSSSVATSAGFIHTLSGATSTSSYIVINAAKSPFMMGFGIANDTEAIAGVISDKFITPKTLHGGLNAVGDAPIYAARAWVNFNGTNGAISSSGNVSSVSDNGVGDFTVNFITAMPDANYAAGIFNSLYNTTNYHLITGSHPTVAPTASQFRIITRIHSAGTDQAAAETAVLSVAIFR